MIAADSDMLIDALRGREPARARVTLELKGGSLATTAVSVFELMSGVRTPEEREVVGALLGALRILPLDKPAAEEGAEIRQSLEANGIPLPMGDCLIAGICRASGAILLTGNRKHFERVQGLALAQLTPRR